MTTDYQQRHIDHAASTPASDGEVGEIDRLRGLVAGFPQGWTIDDERRRLEYDGQRTRELLATRAENERLREFATSVFGCLDTYGLVDATVLDIEASRKLLGL